MFRNYRLQFSLLIILWASGLATPAWAAPGEFGKNAPTDGATGQALATTLSWGESAGATGYQYCYDTTEGATCEGTWTSAATVGLPLRDLVNNTTYYWQVRAVDAGGGITYADDGDWWSFTTQNPALAVDKALTGQSATPIALGAVLTYTITATNVGDVTLSNVVVSDPLLTPVGGTTPCATLAVGASCTLVGVTTVTQADMDAGAIVNTGSAVSAETPTPVTDIVTTPIPQHPALTVDKALTGQSATPIAPGVVLTYRITATNTGDVTLHNVVVSDPLLTPATRTCASVGPGGVCVLTGVTTVTQADIDAGEIVNTGRAVSAETPTPVTDTVTTPIPQHPALTVDKTLTGQSATPIALGAVLTYTIMATNTGDVTLHAVVVSDPLLTPASEDCAAVLPDASCVLIGSYVVQESDFVAGAIVNTVTVTADDPHGDPLAPETDTVTTALVAAPPVANSDQSLGNPIGQVVTVNVLANDMRRDLPIDSSSVRIVNPPAGSMLSPDGKLLVIPNEGYWSVNPTSGRITFTPATGFTDNPTSITYTVADTRGNISNAATVTIVYTPPPEANDDASLGNPVSNAVTVDVLANDAAAPGRTLAPASVQIVDADAGSNGKTLIAAGEGVWTVAPNTGAITFTPEAGFEGNPAPIGYTVADDQGNTSNPATVVVSYTDNPLARNDVSLGNPVGSVVMLPVLSNDVAAPGRTLEPTSVVIVNPPVGSTLSPDGKLLVIPGEGYWLVNTTTGALTFTPAASFTGDPTPIAYMMHDDQENVSNVATVTVTYTPPPMAHADVSVDNPVGHVVTVAVLANDAAAPGRTLVPASVQLVGAAEPGASLAVVGQGVWAVTPTTGALIFTPAAALTGDPTPVAYTVADDQGNRSNAAAVTVTYTQKIATRFLVYLPLVICGWPPIPAAPVLTAINNPDGYGNYAISWSSTEHATSYILQESKSDSFYDATEVYSDVGTGVSLSDRGPTRYYYRVRARNVYGDSGWSNVRSVDVLWEKEPNDNALLQANGPLVSGLTYYGYFPSGTDMKDYFLIYLQSAQTVELWLSNIAAGRDYDLTLRDTALQVVGHSGELENANEHIRTALPSGFYYIQVYNRSGGGSTQAYHLRVLYPAATLTTVEGDVSAPSSQFFNPPPAP